MHLVKLKDIAEVLGISATSFRIFFNVLDQKIARHPIPSPRPTRGKQKNGYEFSDVCTLMREVVPAKWSAVQDEKLYQLMIKQKENDYVI